MPLEVTIYGVVGVHFATWKQSCTQPTTLAGMSRPDLHVECLITMLCSGLDQAKRHLLACAADIIGVALLAISCAGLLLLQDILL